MTMKETVFINNTPHNYIFGISIPVKLSQSVDSSCFIKTWTKDNLKWMREYKNKIRDVREID